MDFPHDMPSPTAEPDSPTLASPYQAASADAALVMAGPKLRVLSNPFHHDPTASADKLASSDRAPAAAVAAAIATSDSSRTTAAAVGQFSFAPATQTTVVTTTTTTTTSFPPLLFKAPRGLGAPDPRQYPLAASPTPKQIRELRFTLNGSPTVFREAENATQTLSKLQQEQQDLRKFEGVLRSVAHFTANPETPAAQLAKTRVVSDGRPPVPVSNNSSSSIGSRASAPDSARSMQQRMQSDHLAASALAGSRDAAPGAKSTRLQIVQTSTPITPSLAARKPDNPRSLPTEASLRPASHARSDALVTPEMDGQEFAQTLSPQPENALASPSQSQPFASSAQSSTSTLDRNHEMLQSAFYDHESSNTLSRPRPAVLNTTAAQDASLPSPSLSPVTAAATLQQRRGYFEPALDSNVTSQPVVPDRAPSPPSDNEDWPVQSPLLTPRLAPESTKLVEPSVTSLMDIPTLLDTFEAMPTEMKTYTMFHLLRRCPKPLLHFVADSVNPALKCDFLSLLPPELCQNIISHLDLKSLCRAAQVSKKWRQIIDTDEKAWKSLFDGAGFVLSTEELQRAVREGWGWQHATRHEDFERDLSQSESVVEEATIDSPISVTMSNTDELIGQDSPLPISAARRTKRKLAQRTRTVSRKHPKRNDPHGEAEALFDEECLQRHLAESEGPYAAAQAANRAVPSPDFGLSSIRQMHLYKSIYRRHHLISGHWMQDKIKPRHLAFKAHHRHVVTCLQFDEEKILSGSDDTNINVYETKTGAMRARLEGHEGGVWALQYVGNTLVSGSTDRSVRVWDIEKGVCTHVFQGHTSTVRCLIILKPTVIGKTPSGKPIVMPKEPLIVTGSRDSTLRVWRLPKPGDEPFNPTGVPQEDVECPYFLRTLAGHGHSVRAIAAHGDTLVSGSYDFTVRVWRISTGETLHRLSGHAQKVYSVVLDHERNRCISGSMDNLVKVWSLETGTILFNLEGHTSLVGLLDLKRDRLVSAAADSTLRIWDPNNGQCRGVLSAHTGAITCFQHDGRKVISGSDRNLKMWNIQNGEFMRDLLSDLSGVWQVCFDERRCVAAVQRNNLTYIEVLDFGGRRDGLPGSQWGQRIVVNEQGHEIHETDEPVDVEMAADE